MTSCHVASGNVNTMYKMEGIKWCRTRKLDYYRKELLFVRSWLDKIEESQLLRTPLIILRQTALAAEEENGVTYTVQQDIYTGDQSVIIFIFNAVCCSIDIYAMSAVKQDWEETWVNYLSTNYLESSNDLAMLTHFRNCLWFLWIKVFMLVARFQMPWKKCI